LGRKGKGYEVTTCSEKKKGLEPFKRGKYDAVKGNSKNQKDPRKKNTNSGEEGTSEKEEILVNESGVKKNKTLPINKLAGIFSRRRQPSLYIIEKGRDVPRGAKKKSEIKK